MKNAVCLIAVLVVAALLAGPVQADEAQLSEIVFYVQ